MKKSSTESYLYTLIITFIERKEKCNAKILRLVQIAAKIREERIIVIHSVIQLNQICNEKGVNCGIKEAIWLFDNGA